MITNNPFTSKTFTTIWKNHFNSGKNSYAFHFANNITFFKPIFFSLYINIGKNLTKGISYVLNITDNKNDFKRKTFLFYDIPQYFKLPTNQKIKNLKIKKIKQYPGYLINLENYTDLNDYLGKTFSKSSKQKFNRYKRRLELCFNIKEKMLIGNVEKTEYDFVFNHFKELLTKRFDDKQIINNNLNPTEWDFYYDVVYPLILEKKAALYVIYNNETPICVRLLYFSETIIFDAITVFDIDYTKFHIGKISIMKILEWCFKNNYKIFDFSKGYYDYKESWSDLKYDFEYHILYDSNAIISRLTASTLSAFFKTKQYLRDKNFNNKLHKLNFLINNIKTTTPKNIVSELEEDSIQYTDDMLVEISCNDTNYTILRKPIYDLLFLSSEHINNIKIYKIKNLTKNYFLLKTTTKSKIICLEN